MDADLVKVFPIPLIIFGRRYNMAEIMIMIMMMMMMMMTMMMTTMLMTMTILGKDETDMVAWRGKGWVQT